MMSPSLSALTSTHFLCPPAQLRRAALLPRVETAAGAANSFTPGASSLPPPPAKGHRSSQTDLNSFIHNGHQVCIIHTGSQRRAMMTDTTSQIHDPAEPPG